MKQERILNGLGNVDEQYILEAAPAKKSSKAAAQKTAKRRVPFKWGIAAACLCLAAATAGVGSIAAAGGLNKSFGQLFHSLSESNYENVLFDINQSLTDNGVTVTLTQGMCDGQTFYVIEKVEFDPSLLTITDEMVQTDEHGNQLRLPLWGLSDLINVKQTDEYEYKDIGGVISRDGGHYKLLEHDSHSLTYLSIYGGFDNMNSGVSPFFADGKEFIVRYAHLENLPGYDAENPYECQFQFHINMEKMSEPNCYTLPEEVYRLTETTKAEEDVADMIINPWYMKFEGGGQTGKILNPSVKADDVPEIEVTLKDGTVYTEKNGIKMYEDYLGKNFSPYEQFFCEFETPVDVTNIKSIRIYGAEMKKGKVTADKSKEKVYDSSNGQKILPATSPATFWDEWKEVWYRHDMDAFGVVTTISDYGHFQYRVKGVTVYDNMYANVSAAARKNDEVDWHDLRPHIASFDEKTGQLDQDCYLLEYEIELKNIDANFKESLGTFDFDNGYFENLFSLELYNRKQPYPDSGQEMYIKENEYTVTGQRLSLKLDKGETKTFHVNFVVKDNHAGGFEQVGLVVCGDRDEGKIEYANLSKAIEEFKAMRNS